MGNRDTRYDLIEPMMSQGKIVSFTDVFKYIKKTVVAIDLGKKVDRFNTLMSRVEEFMLSDLFIIAGFFEIDEDDIIRLIMIDYKRNKEDIRMSSKFSEYHNH